MFYWNVAKTYCLSFAVSAMNWDSVKPEGKSKLARKSKQVAKKDKKDDSESEIGNKVNIYV